MENLELERHVKVIGDRSVNRETVETPVTERDLMRKVGIEVVTGVMRYPNNEPTVRRADAMDFPERFEYMANVFQEMICVDDGKLAVRKGPCELIEIVDDVNSRQCDLINADTTRHFALAATDVQRLYRCL